MTRYAFVNEDIVPLHEAKISILDRGFLLGDGVYEVTAVINGQMVDNQSHLARLKRSLSELQMQSPISLCELEQHQKALIKSNQLSIGGKLLVL